MCNRYNPNFGRGIDRGNAWALTTVRGYAWANLKRAETDRSCPTRRPTSAPTEREIVNELGTQLQGAQRTGRGITRSELEQALVGKTSLLPGERELLGQFARAKRRQGWPTFAHRSTRNIALRLAEGMPIAQASALFGLKT